MGIKLGIAIVAGIGIVLILLGFFLLLMGQGIDQVFLWIITTFGGFILLVIGIHILLASILTYAGSKKEKKEEKSS